ncbi:MAG: hypothetical protein SXQ77_04675 [Halobacteria archaeon]|nr:hypothetical protein [Halobacteria archaeon]
MPKIGGEKSAIRYLVIYVIGIMIGSIARMVMFVFPTTVVNYLERTLLPGDEPE